MKYIVKRNNETIDEIVYNHYGKVLGYLEMVLKINICLYMENIYLTQGLTLELPDIKVQAQNRVNLW